MKFIFTTAILVFMMAGQATGQNEETPAELPPGWWLIPKTTVQFKIGGYVKFDLIHDFNPIGSPDFFDISKIPTDGSKGQTTHLHAKESRLFVDARSPSKVGTLRTYIEGDFYGSSGGFRLRHAFVEINDTWLAGQWWSNFMDESVIPATLDFEKPAAYAFARHAMLRWKHSLSEHSYLGIALEEPKANAQTPAEAGTFKNPLPDLTARYRYTKDWGHVQFSAFAAMIQYRFSAGGTDNVSLFGANLSGQINVLKKDKIIYQVVYGPGVGRFRGGLSAGLDADGNLEAITDFGATIGYTHHWSDAFSTLLVYNHGINDNTAGQPGSAISQMNYLAANLIWHFAKNAFAGAEFLYGTREDIDKDSGSATRLQFSVKYRFN